MSIPAASVPTHDRSQAVVAKRMVAGMSRTRPLLEPRTVARMLGVSTLLLATVGCAAPAAQESQLPSATATPSGRPSASDTPPSVAPIPTSSLAFEPPDGFLPPNSLVRVVVDQLQLRTGPGLAASVQGTALRGERFSVAAYFGPVVRDGVDWYRLGPAIGGDLDAWAAAGSGEDRYLEVVPPDCPSGDPALATLINMASDWDRLACSGDRSLSLEGTLGCGVCDGTMGGDFEPFWLAYPRVGLFLWDDFQAGVGPLTVRTPPDFEIPALGSIVRVSGHYSDPASTTCTMSTFEGEQATAVDSRTAELYCREQFVLDTVEVIGTDPAYTDPYNP